MDFYSEIKSMLCVSQAYIWTLKAVRVQDARGLCQNLVVPIAKQSLLMIIARTDVLRLK